MAFAVLDPFSSSVFNQIFCVFVFFYGASCVYQYFTAFKNRHVHQLSPWFSPFSIPGLAANRFSFPFPWLNWRSNYNNFEYDMMNQVPVLAGIPRLYIGSPDVATQLLSKEVDAGLCRSREFTLYRLLGDSIFSGNGDVWKRHRKILTPAFTHQLYTLTCREAKILCSDMRTSEGWLTRKTIDIPNVKVLTHNYSLKVLSRTVFGISAEWVMPHTRSLKLEFEEALGIVTQSVLWRQVIPSFAYKLPIASIRRIGAGWDKVSSDIEDLQRQKSEKLAEDASDKADLLGRLVASSQGTEKFVMSHRELAANAYIFLIAGHETTASGLTTVLSYLAIHQEDQKRAYEEVMQAKKSGGLTEFTDLKKYRHLQACFLEALRLVPPVWWSAREVTQEISVTISHPVQERLVIPQNTPIIFDMVGICRNKHRFPDPEQFRPSRWYNLSEGEEKDVPTLADALFFGTGPRRCLGQRFALMTAMSFLVNILEDYHLDVPLGMEREIYQSQMLESVGVDGTVLAVKKAPLRLMGRE